MSLHLQVDHTKNISPALKNKKEIHIHAGDPYIQYDIYAYTTDMHKYHTE